MNLISNYGVTSQNNDRDVLLLSSRGNDSERSNERKLKNSSYITPRQYFEQTSKAAKKNQADSAIKDNSAYIINAAKKFGVNPGILGSIIYEEQIENVNMADSVDSIFGAVGIDTSIGVSQVKISTAKMLEEEGYMPKITADKANNISERNMRIKALENNETNIEYAAAYLKYFQDRWKDVYPIIDGKTDILGTLYNLGHEKTSPNFYPSPNPFGENAKSHYYYVRELLELD